MKKEWLGLVGASLSLAVFGFVVMALVRPEPSLATSLATLNVKSSPAGAVITSPTCFTITAGTCGTTNWTSTSTSSIPTTNYQFPLARSINGINYSLVLASLSGCNHGVSGSPANICKVSVPLGSTATISATYTAPDIATLNVSSSPAAVPLDSYSCFTLASGACGTTDWTSMKIGVNIPTTTYTFPTIATISGVNYALHNNSLTGCNQGTSGSPANICKVSVPFGHTANIHATYTLAPSCQPNLVYNPSFESVNTGISREWGNYPAWQIGNDNTNEVPFWDSASPMGNWVFVLNGGNPPFGLVSTTFEGSKYAVLWGHSSGSPAEGVIGELSTPTVANVPYILSAEVLTTGNSGSTSFDIRLRNRQTGAESAPITQTVAQQSSHWVLIRGTLTDAVAYNQVVVRYHGPYPPQESFGLVDDVHVCRVGSNTHWWSTGTIVGVAAAGLGLIVGLGVFTALRHRHSRARGMSKVSQVAVGDFDGDGKTEKFKVADNESPQPRVRIFIQSHKKILGIAALLLAAGGAIAAIYIVTAGGGVWRTKNNPTVNNPTTMKACVNNMYTKNQLFTVRCDSTGKIIETKQAPTTEKAKTSTTTAMPAKTCVDKETVKEGYKLFRSDTYKYCIEYPSVWEVVNSNPNVVTFGTVPEGEPGPGWLKVTHFNAKTVATRVEEIKANFEEPAGPCTQSNVTLAGESGKKLVCIGAANGADNIFYVVSEEGGNLFELSYIGDMAGSSTSYDSQYEVMVNSFLCDMFANNQ